MKDTMASAKVEMYTKWGCPYCVAAKALLDSKGVQYSEYDITMGGPKRAEMLERVPGAVTVPQILIDDRPVVYVVAVKDDAPRCGLDQLQECAAKC